MGWERACIRLIESGGREEVAVRYGWEGLHSYSGVATIRRSLLLALKSCGRISVRAIT